MNRVRKAVLPVAGLGTRIQPAAKTTPKEMLNVFDRPLIVRVIAEARGLISPLPFMSTLATDKLYDESQSAQPADVPSNGKTVDLAAGSVTYKLTAIFPEVVGSELDLIVKFQTPSISDTNLAYQNNIAVIKALVAKYPEVRDVFAGVVARAVDPGGRDYGTLLAMKDVK